MSSINNFEGTANSKDQCSLEDFKCQLDFFEGPLDLLLYLIKKNEIDINNICLEKITNQYLEYLNFMQCMNIDLASEFVVTAATLLHIKTKWLLPDIKDEDEDGDFEDSRLDLLQKLLEYKKFKEAAVHLDDLHELNSSSWKKGINEASSFITEKKDILDVGIFDLCEAFQQIVKRFNFKSKEVFAESFSIIDKTNEIRTLLKNKNNFSFTDMISKMEYKEEVVCFFLAMLELVKLQEIQVKQHSRIFGEIIILKI